MNQIRKFEHNVLGDVRVIIRNGEPWFFSRDICGILGIQNVSQAVKRLDQEDIWNIKACRGDSHEKGHRLKAVSEAGMWQLVLASRKPDAQELKRWLAHVVLPSLRKTGGYTLCEEKMEQCSVLEEKVKSLSETVEKLKAQKEKVCNYLNDTEDLYYELSQERSNLLRQMNDLSFLERRCAKLRSIREEKVQAEEKKREEEKNPMVLDPSGCVIRYADFMRAIE